MIQAEGLTKVSADRSAEWRGTGRAGGSDLCAGGRQRAGRHIIKLLMNISATGDIEVWESIRRGLLKGFHRIGYVSENQEIRM